MSRSALPSLAGLSLRDLEYAAAVRDLRHFGLAAARCAVSQPALSEQIRKLEGRLGVVLFERGSRLVAPTRHGAELLRQADRILAEAHGLLELAGSAAGPLAGPLHLGVIATLGPYYVPHVLRPVRATFPGLALRLVEGQTAGLLDQLRRGGLDAALLALPPPGEGLAIAALFFEPFRLVCPAGHALARRRRPPLDQLDGEGLILLEDGHCLREQALSLCARSAASAVRPATSIEMLWHMIAAGEGYSLLPLLAVQRRAQLRGIVTAAALAPPEPGRTIGLVWRATDPRADGFAELAGFLRAHLPAGLAARP